MRSKRIRSTSAGRVSNAELRREAVRAIELAQTQHMIFLAVLAQRGGSVTVTEGTITQIGTELEFYDYRVRDGLHPGESIVELVDSRKTNEDADGDHTDRSGTGDVEAGTGNGPDSAGGDRGADSGARGTLAGLTMSGAGATSPSPVLPTSPEITPTPDPIPEPTPSTDSPTTETLTGNE
jgi:hypothetical protein